MIKMPNLNYAGDQALLVEGINLSDPAEFVSRLNIALEKSL